MSCAVNFFYNTFAGIIGALTPSSEEGRDLYARTISFGAAEWGNHFALEVPHIEMPEELQHILKQACPFERGRCTDETHFAIFIPGNLTLANLYEKATKAPSSSGYIKTSKDPISRDRWILITKKPLPDTTLDKSSLNRQEAKLKAVGYTAPTILEAAATICALNALGINAFAGQGHSTRCQEKHSGWPVAVGYDRHTGFAIQFNDLSTLPNGVAGVKRFY